MIDPNYHHHHTGAFQPETKKRKETCICSFFHYSFRLAETSTKKKSFILTIEPAGSGVEPKDLWI